MYNASLIMYNITLNAQVSYINTSLHYVGYKIEYQYQGHNTRFKYTQYGTNSLMHVGNFPVR